MWPIDLVFVVIRLAIRVVTHWCNYSRSSYEFNRLIRSINVDDQSLQLLLGGLHECGWSIHLLVGLHKRCLLLLRLLLANDHRRSGSSVSNGIESWLILVAVRLMRKCLSCLSRVNHLVVYHRRQSLIQLHWLGHLLHLMISIWRYDKLCGLALGDDLVANHCWLPLW